MIPFSFIEKTINGLLDGASKVISNFKADPTKVAEMQFRLESEILNAKIKLQEQAAHLFEKEVEDRASARAREVALKNTHGVIIQNTCAVLVILAFIGLIFTSFFLEGEIANNNVVNIMIGSLGTIVVNIFGYWFGSSAGSARKDISKEIKVVK